MLQSKAFLVAEGRGEVVTVRGADITFEALIGVLEKLLLNCLSPAVTLLSLEPPGLTTDSGREDFSGGTEEAEEDLRHSLILNN